MRKTYAILALIAALVVGVYLALPKGDFVESVFPLEKTASVLAYDDKSDGGSSDVRLEAGDSLLSFSCNLGLDTARGAWCGLVFDLSQGDEREYRNWTFVDSVVLDVDAHGTKEILMKIWTYDPDVTKLDEPRTFKLLLKEIPLAEGFQHLVIPMEQFYTPDFWFTDGNIDPSMDRRHQEAVARVEIAPGWNQERGREFSLKFHGISAKGISNFGFGVVLFIILTLTILAIGRKHSDDKKPDGK